MSPFHKGSETLGHVLDGVFGCSESKAPLASVHDLLLGVGLEEGSTPPLTTEA